MDLHVALVTTAAQPITLAAQLRKLRKCPQPVSRMGLAFLTKPSLAIGKYPTWLVGASSRYVITLLVASNDVWELKYEHRLHYCEEASIDW